MNKILIDGDLALRVRNVLRAIVRDLATIVESPRYSGTVGLAAAVAEILIVVRELDISLPDYENDRVKEPACLRSLHRTESTCATPISLPLDSARDLVMLVMGHSRSLDQLLVAVLQGTPDELRKPTTLRVARVMGYLYTDIMRPLHLQHRELTTTVLGGAEP